MSIKGVVCIEFCSSDFRILKARDVFIGDAVKLLPTVKSARPSIALPIKALASAVSY